MTQILHALHLLQRGYSSRELAEDGRRQLVNFDEHTYGNHYRSYVQRLKEYHRLGDLRRFHMKHLL
jgi:hypothetical protein